MAFGVKVINLPNGIKFSVDVAAWIKMLEARGVKALPTDANYHIDEPTADKLGFQWMPPEDIEK